MGPVINGMYDLETLKRLNDEEVERRDLRRRRSRTEVKVGMIAQSEATPKELPVVGSVLEHDKEESRA
jgi:ribosomal protein L18E